MSTTASTAPEEVAAAAERAEAERVAYEALKAGLWRWSVGTTAACFGAAFAFYSRVRATLRTCIQCTLCGTVFKRPPFHPPFPRLALLPSEENNTWVLVRLQHRLDECWEPGTAVMNALRWGGARAPNQDTAASYGVGALGGLMYLRLLNKSVDGLGASFAGAAGGQARFAIPIALALGYNRSRSFCCCHIL